jgi:hypothetical protein
VTLLGGVRDNHLLAFNSQANRTSTCWALAGYRPDPILHILAKTLLSEDLSWPSDWQNGATSPLLTED